MSTKDSEFIDNHPMLSIIIPLYNDREYISQCIESVLINKSKGIEIVISDDHSSDGSADICRSYNDSRIKIHKPNKPLGAANNWLYGLSKAKGVYVYFLSGDDYLSKGVLDNVIDTLDGESIYTAPINCFNDKTFEIFDKQAYPEQYKKILGRCPERGFIYNYMNHFNHDELILSFFPRGKIMLVNKLMNHSASCIFWYWTAIGFEKSVVKNIPVVVVMKRYNHSYKRTYWKSSRVEKQTIAYYIDFIYNSHSFKSFCDIYNSVVIAGNYKSLKLLINLLFRNRKILNLETGLFGKFPAKWGVTYFRPNVLIELLISPLFSINKLIKSLLIKLRVRAVENEK
jgi:glycosyltransferase involved in cell wall biosynthesis